MGEINENDWVEGGHHKVFKSGKYYHKIGDGSDHKIYKREYNLNKIVGVKSKLIISGETITLKSLDMGLPKNSWELQLLPTILEAIDNFPVVGVDKIYKVNGERRKSFRGGEEWPKIVYNYGRSIGLDKSNILLKELKNVRGELFTGNFLVHRDPHLGNIVFDENSIAKFIDWESGLVGGKDITRGVLYNNIFNANIENNYKNTLLSMVVEAVDDVEVFGAAKLVDGISAKIFEISKIIDF